MNRTKQKIKFNMREYTKYKKCGKYTDSLDLNWFEDIGNICDNCAKKILEQEGEIKNG